MAKNRGNISDYPEHLNPFYEGNEKFRFWKFGKTNRSGSFSDTLRNTFTLKSFRGKKREQLKPTVSPPEIRKHDTNQGVVPQYRQTLPTTLSYQSEQNITPLPRSRFSERISKSEIISGSPSISRRAPSSLSTSNPFAEEEENVAELKPKRIRRKKRRAPLPPHAVREEGDIDTYLNASSKYNLSKWSLTSVETDISTYSENDSIPLDIANREMSAYMNNITKEMEKLTDEIQFKESTCLEKNADIPDLIVSSREIKNQAQQSNEEKQLDEWEDGEEVKQSSNPITEKLKDSNESIEKELNSSRDSIKDQELKQSSESIKENAPKKLVKEEQLNQVMQSQKHEDFKTSLENLKLTDIQINETLAQVDEATNEVKEESKNLTEEEKSTDENSNIIGANRSKEINPPRDNNQQTSVSITDNINFNERKSIYIGDSNDEINKNSPPTTTSIPQSPRCKTEITFILDNNTENSNENDECRPTPKKRTHKLSKSELLGNVTETS